MELKVRTLHAVMFEDLKLTCFRLAGISRTFSPMRKTFKSIFIFLGIHSQLRMEGCICLFMQSVEFARVNADTKPRPDHHLEHCTTQRGDC